MSSYDPERVLGVKCPSCGARAGERCKTKHGRTRAKYDFHAVRKGVVYPEFVTKRPGLSDVTRKANAIVDALDEYLQAERELVESLHMRGYEKKAIARDKLVDAIKDGLTNA